MRLDALATLTVDADGLGVRTGRLALRRAWPRGPDHVLVEYREGTTTVAGQWFADPTRLAAVADETARAAPAARVVRLPAAGVLLQAGGADRRLAGLAELVADPQAVLVAHRPERRAVVRVGSRWVKLLRPEAAVRLVAAATAAASAPGVVTSRLLDHDLRAGRTIWSALPGTSLYDLLRGDRVVEAARLVGAALRGLHDTPPSPGLPQHGPDEEYRVVSRWLDHRETHLGPLPPAPVAAAREVADRLAAPTGRRVLVHRDFYDKQVTVTGDGRVGLLDFDTLAVGEAALDLGNALAHLELRALQGGCPPATAAAAASALLAGYRPDREVIRRLPAYLAATRLRLWCVYAFRPRWRASADALQRREQ